MILSPSMDGYIAETAATWNLTREAATGNSVSTSGERNAYAIRTNKATTRAGATEYQITRSYFHFDTSSITTPVESAYFSLRGYAQDDADIIVVKATSDIETLTTVDFDSIDGWTTGDNSSNVTIYSVRDHPSVSEGQISVWAHSDYNDIQLTHEAKADMFRNDDLHICILDYTYDLLDVEPTTFKYTGFYYEDSTLSTIRPKLHVTLNNAIGFGTNF